MALNGTSDDAYTTLDQAAAAWVETKTTLRELSTRQSQERKRLKRIEKALMEQMKVAGVERLEHGGRTVVIRSNITEE
jgi:hypothetical protein